MARQRRGVASLPIGGRATSSCADAAVLPRGGVAYLSGQPDEGGLAASAVTRSMSGSDEDTRALEALAQAGGAGEGVLAAGHLRRRGPARSAEVLPRIKSTPPVVFVEWLAAVPVEIEMIAQFPLSAGKPAEDVVYFTPPEVRPSNTFSKVALAAKPSGRSTFPACTPVSRAAASPRPSTSSSNCRRS